MSGWCAHDALSRRRCRRPRRRLRRRSRGGRSRTESAAPRTSRDVRGVIAGDRCRGTDRVRYVDRWNARRIGPLDRLSAAAFRDDQPVGARRAARRPRSCVLGLVGLFAAPATRRSTTAMPTRSRCCSRSAQPAVLLPPARAARGAARSARPCVVVLSGAATTRRRAAPTIAARRHLHSRRVRPRRDSA